MIGGLLYQTPRSRITTVWYTGVATAMYAGSTVAVLTSTYLTLDHGNWFLLSWMIIALSVNLFIVMFLGGGESKRLCAI